MTEPGYIYPEPEKVLWYYAEDQPLYENMPNVTFIKGMPTEESYDEIATKKRTLVVIDDMMVDAIKDKFVSSLFYRGKYFKNAY